VFNTVDLHTADGMKGIFVELLANNKTAAYINHDPASRPNVKTDRLITIASTGSGHAWPDQPSRDA
jgi:hypothetical protein